MERYPARRVPQTQRAMAAVAVPRVRRPWRPRRSQHSTRCRISGPGRSRSCRQLRQLTMRLKELTDSRHGACGAKVAQLRKRLSQVNRTVEACRGAASAMLESWILAEAVLPAFKPAAYSLPGGHTCGLTAAVEKRGAGGRRPREFHGGPLRPNPLCISAPDLLPLWLQCSIRAALSSCLEQAILALPCLPQSPTAAQRGTPFSNTSGSWSCNLGSSTSGTLQYEVLLSHLEPRPVKILLTWGVECAG